LPPARSQSALFVMFSDDGVVDEPSRDPDEPELLEPEPGVLGEVDGWLPLPDPVLPEEPLPIEPLPVDPLPGVPPPVCANAKAGARPRATARPVMTSFFIAPSSEMTTPRDQARALPPVQDMENAETEMLFASRLTGETYTPVKNSIPGKY
jgi:hypothetical protein